MKILFFCICISCSLSADDFTRQCLPQHAPNEQNLTDEPADSQLSTTLRNESNPSDGLEPVQSLRHNPNFPINSGLLSGLDSQRGACPSRNYENPNLETSNERQDGARGTARLQETWSSGGPNSSSGLHSLRITSTDDLSAVTDRHHNVAEGSNDEPNMNIRSANVCTSVRPKRRWAESSADLPSFAGTFGDYWRHFSRFPPTKLPVRSGLDSHDRTRDGPSVIAPSVIASITPMDLSLEQSSNYVDPNSVQASRSIGEDEASSCPSLQNYLPMAETLQAAATPSRINGSMFHYVRTLYTLKDSLEELRKHFGTVERLEESLLLAHSRRSVHILNEIQDNVNEMVRLGTDVDFLRFGIDSPSLNSVLSTVTELTPHIEIYLVIIRNNGEEAEQRKKYLTHITKKLEDQLSAFVKSATSELIFL